MKISAELVRKLKQAKGAKKADGDPAFAEAAREAFNFAKDGNADGFVDALHGAISIAMHDKDDS